MSESSDLGKIGVSKLTRRAGTRLGWREVLGAIQDTWARSGLVAALGHAGFSVDDFANVNKPREIACTWLSRYEDALEASRGKMAAEERARCKAVRRRLELELFP